MDADLKIALDKALAVCEWMDHNETGPAIDVLIRDVSCFINKTCLLDPDVKFGYFCKVYLDRLYTVSDANCTKYGEIPESIQICYRMESKRDYKEKYNRTKDLIAFFNALGMTLYKLERRKFVFSVFSEQMVNMNKLLEATANIKTNAREKDVVSCSVKEESNQVKESVEIRKTTADQTDNEVAEPSESLEELMDNLNSLIGLQAVKDEVRQIVNLIKVQKKGEEFGAKTTPLSLHLVFYGNPGTGKTTVARLLAKIYKALGVLSKGQFVEVDRSGLVAGYVGQTAIKTQEVIDKAMGGILFIDEAYSLTHGKGESDFGQEAVDTLLKAMEDHRDDFLVIVAGYPDLMKEFIASNPGLKSRFNQFINFEDYKPNELIQIFKLQCDNQGLVIADGCETFIQEYFSNLYNNRSDDYANGRDVRNYFDKVIKARANRLAPVVDEVSYEDYMTITYNDLVEASVYIQKDRLSYDN